MRTIHGPQDENVLFRQGPDRRSHLVHQRHAQVRDPLPRLVLCPRPEEYSRGPIRVDANAAHSPPRQQGIFAIVFARAAGFTVSERGNGWCSRALHHGRRGLCRLKPGPELPAALARPGGVRGGQSQAARQRVEPAATASAGGPLPSTATSAAATTSTTFPPFDCSSTAPPSPRSRPATKGSPRYVLETNLVGTHQLPGGGPHA